MWSHLKTTDHNGITQKKNKQTNKRTNTQMSKEKTPSPATIGTSPRSENLDLIPLKETLKKFQTCEKLTNTRTLL